MFKNVVLRLEAFGRKFLRPGFLILLAGTMTSCVYEEELSQAIDETKYYLSLEVAVTGESPTRSYTSENGTSSDETFEATDSEKSIERAKLYFVDDDTNKILGIFEAYPSVDNSGNKILAAQIDKNNLKIFFRKKVRLFVIGNDDLLTYNFENANQALIKESPWGNLRQDHRIPMTNLENYIIDFCEIEGDSEEDFLGNLLKLFQEEILNISDENFNGTSGTLKSSGVLNLERTLARIDYKDKERNQHAEESLLRKPFTYQLGESDILLKLHSMQLINVSKEQYLFRHTISGTLTEAEFDKTDEKEPELFGVEKYNETEGYNWIADNDFNKKMDIITKGIESGYYHNQGKWDSENKSLITIEELNKRVQKDGFHPWAYITENTLPSTKAMTSDLCTQVAFRFEILDITGEPLRTYSRESLPNGIYFNNDNSIEITFGEERQTIFQEEEGYFLTYYWNIEHNVPEDWNENQDLAPMHYAVVRNNVYQITVGSIENLPENGNPTRSVNKNGRKDIKVIKRIGE